MKLLLLVLFCVFIGCEDCQGCEEVDLPDGSLEKEPATENHVDTEEEETQSNSLNLSEKTKVYKPF